MEFGKLDDLDHVDWSIPADDKKAIHFLQTLPPQPSSWFLGTPTWGSRSWLGKIYPEGAKASEFLHYYSRAFTTIELNTTHYRLPTTEIVQSWTTQVPQAFRFCPKFPQTISHARTGLLDRELMSQWQRALNDFKEYLGVSFLQFPPYFTYDDRALLHQFLKQWPSELPLALEFRHASWFTHGTLLPALVNYLQKKQIGLVITDVAGRRDVLHTSITAPFVLLRFIGNALHESDFERCNQWQERLEAWRSNGLQQVYFFAHEPDDITCPELTSYIVRNFNQKLQLNWPDPLKQAETPQVSLFE